MNSLSRKLLPFAACVLLSIGQAAPAVAQTVMKFGTASINDTQHHWMRLLKEGVEKRAGDRMKVEIFPSSQLGSVPRMIEGLQLGTIEGYLGPTSFLVGVDQRFQALDAPFLFDDLPHAMRATHDPEFINGFWRLGEAKAIATIGMFCPEITTFLSIQPIRKLDDFKGKKVRVFASRIERESMRRLGATAAPMPFDEVLTAIQNGTLDSVKSSISLFVAFRYYTIVKTLTRTHESVICAAATISKAWYDKLPADLRRVLDEEARKADDETQAWSYEFMNRNNKAWADGGGELIDLAAADKAALRALLQPVGDEIVKEQPDLRDIHELTKRVAARHR